MRESEREERLEARVRAVAERLGQLLNDLQAVSWQIWSTVERQRASDAKLLEINLRLRKTLALIPKEAESAPNAAEGAADAAAGGPEGSGTGGEAESFPAERARRRSGTRFTYLDYLELRAEEFKKFREMPPIADAEIEAFDPDESGPQP